MYLADRFPFEIEEERGGGGRGKETTRKAGKKRKKEEQWYRMLETIYALLAECTFSESITLERKSGY